MIEDQVKNTDEWKVIRNLLHNIEGIKYFDELAKVANEYMEEMIQDNSPFAKIVEEDLRYMEDPNEIPRRE